MKKNIIFFLFSTIITCIIFKEFLNMHYATDTYNIINLGYLDYAIKHSLNDGRIFMCLIGILASAIKIPINYYVIILTVLAIIVSNISIVTLKSIVEKYKKTRNYLEDIILSIICYTIIFNFMWLENMYFVECFVMAVSVLFYIIGAKSYIENKLLKTIMFVIIGMFFYQGTLNTFITFVVLFLIFDNSHKSILKKVGIAILICAFACLINYLSIELVGNIFEMEQKRIDFKHIVIMPWIIIMKLPEVLLYTSNIFPKGLFMVIFTLLICFYNRKKEIVMLSFFSIASCFGLSLFTDSAFGSARMLFSIGALIGNILLLFYVNMNCINYRSFFVVALLWNTIIVLNYNYIINEHEKVVGYVQEECNEIKIMIDTYQKKNNVKLKYISIYNDLYPSQYYKNSKNHSWLCLRPLAVEWSDEAVINYYCDTNLIEVKPNEKIFMQYFYNKDWNALKEEQFIFIGDTLHYCIY